MKTLKFNWRDELVQVNPDDIICFKADANNTYMKLASGQEQKLCMNLLKVQTTLEEQLGNDFIHFERIGRDLILRTAYIFSIHVLLQKITLIAPNGYKLEEIVSKDAIKKLKKKQEEDTVIALKKAQLRDLLTGKTYLLKMGMNGFGRKSSSSQCQHPIDNGDAKISRDHFRIQLHYNDETTDYEYDLMDSQSGNGTFLNQKLATKDINYPLSFGDIIKAGETEFIFEEVDTDKTEMY